MMRAVPGASAVTIPFDAIDTTPGSVVAHITGRPTRLLPARSRKTAIACTDVPTVTAVADRDTSTAATGDCAATTDTGAVAVNPSLAAVMTAVPAATPVITPFDGSMRAMLGALDVQTT